MKHTAEKFTPEVLNLRKLNGVVPEGAVLIDRRTKWGNPFKITASKDAKTVVAQYRKWLYTQPHLIAAAKAELRGKDLVCWCSPDPCHGDVLLEIANS